MLHPHTELRRINDLIGCGVFATEPLPAGTIVWAPDPLDRHFTAAQLRTWPAPVLEATLRYMYRDYRGRYVLSWDHARYVNHSFHPNCIITPLGFTLAVADIPAGGELLEDYGTLNIIEPFEPVPEPGTRREVVRPDDLLHHADEWDEAVRRALARSLALEQPLAALLTPARRRRWKTVATRPQTLPSLRTLFAGKPDAF